MLKIETVPGPLSGRATTALSFVTQRALRRLFPVDGTPLLDGPWPDDLDPATVSFHQRSVSILRWAGYYDDPSLFNTLTEAEVLSWWNIGPTTVTDIRETGNAAIPRHHEEMARRRRFEADLASLADERWAKHIWFKDRRFKAYLPKGDGTVYDIATSGADPDRGFLWDQREALRRAVAVQAALFLPDAVSGHVEAISGQHGERLDMLLAVTGLNGLDPISAREGSRRIGRSSVRGGQLRRRLFVLRNEARPPVGAWMPQVTDAVRDGWPKGYTERGVEATRDFFGGSRVDVGVSIP